MTCQQIPYLTADLPGIGGRIKVNYEDFRVEEIPAYFPSGHGEHTFFQIEKWGLPTFAAINDIARALGIKPQDIGYAGLKDAHALARQILSVHQIAPETILQLRLPSVSILWAKKHTNKLKPGHLAGNRFAVRVRDVTPSAMETARSVLEVLQRRGVPNHFGSQRFGRRGDTHTLGQALIRNDAVGFMRAFLGHPQPSENQEVQLARRCFENDDLQGALSAWPARYRDERRALQTLLARGRDERGCLQALRGIPKRLRTFFVSAYQSHLFNKVVSARIDTLDRAFAGDVATKHDSGASFLVVDPELEQPRVDRFEISPSGPLFGYRMLLAEGKPGQLERQLLVDEGLALEDFKAVEALKLRGARRALRIPLREVDLLYDEGLVLRFALPAGSYATNVLTEVMKNDIAPIDE